MIELLQGRFFRGVENGLLEGDVGVPAFELQGGDLVFEEGGVVGQAPREGYSADAREAGQEARGEGGGFRPGVALEERLLAREGVAEGGADSLIEAALRATKESSFGEVAVVDVAGEDQDGRRWGASIAACDALIWQR